MPADRPPVMNTSSIDMEARLSSIAASGGSIRDPYGTTIYGTQSASSHSSGSIVIGKVVWSGGETYDCTVRVGDIDVGCCVAQSAMSWGSGSSVGSVPQPGTYVVVFLYMRGVAHGVVLGTLPLGWMYGGENAPSKTLFGHGDDMDKDESDENASFSSIPGDRLNSEKCASPSGRPGDMVPGDYMVVNENDVGLYCGMFSSTLMGGPAYVRATRIDDSIRIRSTNLTLWTDPEIRYLYNDNGALSTERKTYMFQGYRSCLGLEGVDSSGAVWPNRPCMVEYGGYFGDVWSFFVPSDPNSPAGVASKYGEIPETGQGAVASGWMSENGKLSLRCSGGITLETYDRIPVPRRMRRPSDPEGDGEDGIRWDTFRYKRATGCGVSGLELYEKEATDNASMYTRFDAAPKDFHVDQESDIDPVDPSKPLYEENLGKDSGKSVRAGVYIGENGSISIRDAWGSEILMDGGTVTITAARGITAFSGGSAVVMARDSAVLKSFGGTAEVCASEAVNVFGNDHVSIAGGNDETESGGVVIEALGSGEMKADKNGPSSWTGISLIASEGVVSMTSRKAYVSAKDVVSVTTGEKGDSRTGDIVMSTGYFGVSSPESTLYSEDGFIDVRNGMVEMVSGGSMELAASSLTEYNGKQMVTLLGVSMDEDPIKDRVEEARDEYGAAQRVDAAKTYSYDYMKTNFFLGDNTDKSGLRETYRYLSARDMGISGGSSSIEGGVGDDDFVLGCPPWKRYEYPDDYGLREDVEVFPKDKRHTMHGYYGWPFGPSKSNNGKIMYALDKFFNGTTMLPTDRGSPDDGDIRTGDFAFEDLETVKF